MRLTAKLHGILIALGFLLLGACVGGANLGDPSLGGMDPVGGEGPSQGGGGVGQGQPTIQPGADHQPGIPDEPYDPQPDDIAAPQPEPSEDPDDGPGPGGPSGLTY